jgi:hypothetical protein
MAKDEMDIEDPNGDKALADIARKLLMGKSRDATLELIATEFPDNPIPEVKMKKELAAVTAPLQKKIDELEKAAAANSRNAAWEAKRKPLRDKGLGDAEIEKVEKFMTEKQIFNHEIGYDVYQRNQQIAAPTTSHTAVEMPTTVELLKDPRKWANDEAHKAVDELIAARR